MKIAQVDSARGWRGGQNQVRLTAAGLTALGHEVMLACAAGGVLESRARDLGLAVAPLRFAGDLSPLAVAGLARLFRSWGPDVVHAHDPHAVSAALLAARWSGRPPVVASRRVDFRVRGRLSRWKYGACARVVAASGAIARVLEADGVGAAHLRVVHEGVPDRPPVPGGAEALRALGVPAGAPVVGNVAALVDHKDHATLVAAAALVLREMPHARFVIVGDGERRRAVERDIAAHGLHGRVLLAGFRRDLDALIPAFDVFCLSSRQEGLGTSVLDAMAFARPVVATTAGGIPEAVEDGVTGRLVAPGDAGGLALALRELLSRPEERRRLGEGGRRAFCERFTAQRMVERTLDVYRELA
ncbi:MAG TPA: glycosyltransferase [Vicinamibacteria bacterium]|jgi:glycosyltransferase involved in cell wall biosynthesis